MAVWLVFGQTRHFGFVTYDDDTYVFENPVIKAGLTLAGLRWFFTNPHSDNWHPLTSISHMLDVQLYGPFAGGHHVTSVLLHAVATVLLFLILQRMTGAFWRSALVAVLFAVHPLRVESVAWISERKDVLSGVFFMLTLWAYVTYVRSARPRVYYVILLVAFTLGLMSKPMLVTMPFLLLLLDYWPLRRMGRGEGEAQDGARAVEVRRRGFGFLILEKLPLLALATVSGVMTVVAQRGSLTPIERLPLSLRLENGLIAYMTYLRQMVCPTKLAVLYPLPRTWPSLWLASLAVIVVGGLSYAAWRTRKAHPYFFVGWFWYLGMLVPVLGLIQAGEQARADRYTYLPSIGIGIAVVWLLHALTRQWRSRPMIFAPISAVVVLTFAGLAWRQVPVWRNGETLWRHTIEVTGENPTAENNLGNSLLLVGKTDEGIPHYREALRLRPNYPAAYNNLGTSALRQGKLDEAIANYQTALSQQPNSVQVQINLAGAYAQAGRLNEAIDEYNEILKQREIARVYADLAAVLIKIGRGKEAIQDWQRSLELIPFDVRVQNDLAWFLSTSTIRDLRNGAAALQLADRFNQASNYNDPILLRTLAASYAESEEFTAAQQVAQRALGLAAAQGKAGLADKLRTEEELYRMNFKFKDPEP